MENIVNSNLAIPQPTQPIPQPEQVQQPLTGYVPRQTITPEQAEAIVPEQVGDINSVLSDNQTNNIIPDETGNTWEDYLKEDGYLGQEEQAKAKERRKMINEIPIFEKAAQWTGETLKNTLVERPKGLLNAFVQGLNPWNENSYYSQLWNYGKDKASDIQEAAKEGYLSQQTALTAAEVGRDISDLFVFRPLTGQSISDLTQQPLEESLANYLDYIHEGGLLDTGLTLAGTKPGQAAGRVVGRGALKVADVIDSNLPGKLKNYGKDWLKTQKARQDLRAEGVKTKAELTNKLRDIKQDILNVSKKEKLNISDFAEIIDHMRGVEGKNLSMLRPELAKKYQAIKPVLDRYETMMSQYKTAMPKNTMEIIEYMRNKKARGGRNWSYQLTQEALEESGLLDLGNYVKKGTNEIVYEGNPLNTLSDTPQPSVIPEGIGNTEFIIPESNLGILAQIALEDSPRGAIAKVLFDAYGLSREGKINRISQGLAKVDKSAELGKKGPVARNRENYLATERVWGNASSKDIATQWLEPDNIFQYSLKSVLQMETVKALREEFAKTGQPIRNKVATPEDVRYVRLDTLVNANKLEKIEQFSLKEPPVDAQPGEFLPIDKYTLKAYKDLYGKRGWIRRNTPIIKDMITLYKQALLAGGKYLGANFLGGLHQLATHSNINLVGDIMNAMKTRGALIKEYGIERELPIKGDVRMSTDPNTLHGKILRVGYHVGDTTSYIQRAIDAKMQNLFAETAAHNVFRKKGIKFENRNAEWLAENMSKEEIYKALTDIEKMALIYGEETLIPREILQFMEVGNPFIRWVDQATMSSLDTMAKNPIAYGYLQGVVLGGLAWDNNRELQRNNLGIKNPQDGKMYKINPRTGDTKVTTSEVIPQQTSLRAFTTPDYLYKVSTNASVGWLLDMIKVKDQYDKLKKLKKYPKGIENDFQRKIRLENGVATEIATPNEIIHSILRETTPMRAINNMFYPMIYGVIGKQSYKPYNDQLFVGPGGDPNKPYGSPEVIQGLAGSYTRNALEGIDIPITEKKANQLAKSRNKREAKDEEKKARRQEALNREKNLLKRLVIGGEE